MIAKDRARTHQLLRMIPDLSDIQVEEMFLPVKDEPRTMTDDEWALVSEYIFRNLCMLNIALHMAVRFRSPESWWMIVNEEAIDGIILEKRKFYALASGPLKDVLDSMVPEKPDTELWDFLSYLLLGVSKKEFIEISTKWKGVIETNNWQSDVKILFNEQY